MVSILRKLFTNMSTIAPEVGSGGKPLDVNRYATKKTIAQGMLDIALLTANASQLKYILQVGHKHEFYTLMLGLITTSIILQICVGILFLIIGGLDLNRHNDRQPAIILNDVILIMVFLISIVNVVISGFGLQHSGHAIEMYSLAEKPPVVLGVITLLLSTKNINYEKYQRSAEKWHHAAVCCITLGVIIDVLKMSFAGDVPLPEKITV